MRGTESSCVGLLRLWRECRWDGRASKKQGRFQFRHLHLLVGMIYNLICAAFGVASIFMFALALNLNQQNLQLQLQGSVRRLGFSAGEKRK